MKSKDHDTAHLHNHSYIDQFCRNLYRLPLDQLATLDRSDAINSDSARSVWDWIFKSDGFFAEFDAARKEEEKRNALLAKAALVATGARTSASGVLGAIGIANVPHRFYGEETVD